LKYDVRLLERYRKALDKALQLATKHNVKPIHGTSVILCDLRQEMHRPCASAKGLGKPRTVYQEKVNLLLCCCVCIYDKTVLSEVVWKIPFQCIFGFHEILNSTVPQILVKFRKRCSC
jgi:TROVE domain